MNRKGFTQGSDQQIPPSLAYYEDSKAKDESLYLDSEEYAEIVSYYTGLKLFNEAEQAVKDGINIHPHSSKILLEEAYLYLEQNKVEFADEVIKQIPDQTDYYVLMVRADIALNQNKKQKAKEILDLIEEKEDIDAILDVVYLYMEYKIYDEVKKWLDLGKKEFNEDEEYILACADYFLATDQNQNAVINYNLLLDSDPYCNTYWWGLARALFELSEYNKCLEACDFGLVTDENFSAFYILKGQCFQQVNLYQQAISMFQEALDRDCLDKDLVNLLLSQSYANLHKEDGLENPEEEGIINENEPNNFLKLITEQGSNIPLTNCTNNSNNKNQNKFADSLQNLYFQLNESKNTPIVEDEVCIIIEKAFDAFDREDYATGSDLLIQAEQKAKTEKQLSKLANVYFLIGDHELAHRTLDMIQTQNDNSFVQYLKHGCLALLERNNEDILYWQSKAGISFHRDNLKEICDLLSKNEEHQLVKILLRHFAKLKE